VSARDSDADFEAAIMNWRAAHEETIASLAALEAALDAERDSRVRKEMAQIERRIANMSEAERTHPTALALTMQLQSLQRAYPELCK